MYDFSTPEAALQSFQQAHLLHDVAGAVAALTFIPRAVSELQRSAAPSPELIAQRAKELEAKYRQSLEQFGFGRDIDIGNCKIVAILERTESTARIALSNLKQGAVFAKRIVKEDTGWRVVYGP